MGSSSDDSPIDDRQRALRLKILGLGETSLRKSYFPELQKNLADLTFLKSAVDHSSDVILIVAMPGGDMVHWNATAASLMGLASVPAGTSPALSSMLDAVSWSELSGRFAESSVGDIPSAPRAAMRATLSVLGRGVIPVELTFGKHRWDGRDFAVIVARDISRQLAEERALAASQTKYRRLYDSLMDGFVRVTMDGRIVEYNQTYREMLGYSDQELPALTYVDITPSRWHEIEGRIVAEQVLVRGYSEVYEKEYRGKDGRIFPVELRTNLIRDERGEPESMWAIVRDISARRMIEDQMRSMQKLESLGMMAGGIAHDFNNLLMGVLGNAELALMEMASGHPAAPNVEQIKVTSLRMAEIARQMLAYSGKSPVTATPLILADVAREMVDLLRVSISKKIDIGIEVDGHVPLMMGDSGQIRQVVMNLILNAADAIGDAVGSIRIRLSGRVLNRADLAPFALSADLPEGDYVCLDVIDTGCGMSDELRRRVFDPFFTTKATGRGMGLAVVQGIVRSHQGGLWIESAVGRGSTFHLAFARASGDAVDAPAMGARSSVDSQAGRTILVVDDEDAVRNVSASMLRRAGHTVLTACDGVEALEVLRRIELNVDLVLLDHNMPRKSGVETLREIRELAPRLPVLMCSGYTEDGVEPEGEVSGVAGFLQKPFAFATLMTAVRKVFS